MNSRKRYLFAIAIAFSVVYLASCSPKNERPNQQMTDSTSNVAKLASDKAKGIFYSLPSPVEMANSLDMAGVELTTEFLNPAQDVDKYITTNQQAINLGIYSADLSFCAFFEQNQLVIAYLRSVKKLSEQLGIYGFFSDSTLHSIQQNMNDKERIVKFVSEAFSKSTTFLEDKQRDEIATKVLVGGWIESFYLSLNCASTSESSNEKLIQVIEYQKITLDDLQGMLDLFKDDNYLSQVSAKLSSLQAMLNKIGDKIEAEQLQELISLSAEIRMGFIQ